MSYLSFEGIGDLNMQSLPQALIYFLSDPIILESIFLPEFYPAPVLQNFLDFQDGYRINGHNGECLIGDQDGDWSAECYVVAQNSCADPFVIFSNESKESFPVYFAYHGAGHWDFEKIADSLKSFRQDLVQLQTLEAEPAKFADYIVEHKDLNCEFWHELHTSLIESIADKLNDTFTDAQEHEPWIYGQLILTEIGVNKIQVVNFLKQHFKITGAKALALSKHLPIELGRGVEKFCQPNIKYLERIGAKVIFIADRSQ